MRLTVDGVGNVMQYRDTDTLLDGLENNTKRYARIVCEAADDAMPVPTRRDFEEDIYDILYNQACMATACPSTAQQPCEHAGWR